MHNSVLYEKWNNSKTILKIDKDMWYVKAIFVTCRTLEDKNNWLLGI